MIEAFSKDKALFKKNKASQPKRPTQKLKRSLILSLYIPDKSVFSFSIQINEFIAIIEKLAY